MMALLSLSLSLALALALGCGCRPAAGTDVDIAALGCKPGGGPCTQAFAAAMRQVSAGGGGTIHVRGPGPVTTAGIEMLSHVTLQVHAGASINASARLADWAPRRLVFPACAAGQDPPELDHGVLGGLFYASLQTNFTIKGPGAVNGAAKAWNGYGAAASSGMPVTAAAAAAAVASTGAAALIRSNMFVFSQCTDVVVEDLLIQDSSAWTLNPQYSQRLSFRRLHIDAPALGRHGHNTDGFDPWACEDAEFVDSYYSAGCGPTSKTPCRACLATVTNLFLPKYFCRRDDCVAVKSGKDSNATAAGAWPCGTSWPSRNITINNITCDGSHGLTIGSEMSGGIEDVRFTNIRIYNSGPSVRIKSQCGRQAWVRNILYENITGDNLANAVWIDMQYFSTATSCPAAEVSQFSNITVTD